MSGKASILPKVEILKNGNTENWFGEMIMFR